MPLYLRVRLNFLDNFIYLFIYHFYANTHFWYRNMTKSQLSIELTKNRDEKTDNFSGNEYEPYENIQHRKCYFVAFE